MWLELISNFESRARLWVALSKIVEKFGRGSLKSRNVPLERSTMVVFRIGKQLPFFRFDGVPHACTSSTCCRRPSTKRSRRRHFRVKVQRTYCPRPVPRRSWRAGVAGVAYTYVYANAYVAYKGTHGRFSGGPSVCKSQNRSKDYL